MQPWRCLAFLAVLCTISSAHAASDAEIKLIYDGVRARFADLSAYCKLADAERRQVTVQVTMALVGARKLADPAGAGPLAGAQLRRDCGIEATPAADTAVNVRWTATAKPLAFDASRQTAGMFTTAASLANRVYAPEGPGPFPAVVLNHTIGGVSQHMLIQARALLDDGYAVLVVDSYGPRSLRAGHILFPAEVAKDAYDALAHLSGLPFIDRSRIYQAGYSLGALASGLLASPQGAQVFKAPGRFRASVGHYGTCALQNNPASPRLEMLSADSDRPVLMLMAELDVETPPKACFPLLEQMKAAGKDADWHIYPNTTHGWDKAENNGYVYRSASGETMMYRFDPAVTKDATQRMIAFFKRYN